MLLLLRCLALRVALTTVAAIAVATAALARGGGCLGAGVQAGAGLQLWRGVLVVQRGGIDSRICLLLTRRLRRELLGSGWQR